MKMSFSRLNVRSRVLYRDPSDEGRVRHQVVIFLNLDENFHVILLILNELLEAVFDNIFERDLLRDHELGFHCTFRVLLILP